MYQYIRAAGRYRSGPKGLLPVDISQYRLADVIKYFQEMQVVVNDAYYPSKPLAFDLFQYSEEIRNSSLTIQQWLDTKSSTPIPYLDTVPGTTFNHVTIEDIQYKGFDLLPGNAKLSDDKQDRLTSAAPDLRIRKTSNSLVDYPKLSQYGLWLVNGHLVRSVPTSKEVYLLHGGKCFNTYDNIHVGYLNFYTLSSLNTYPTVKEDILIQNLGGKMQAMLKTIGDLSNKTVWMSIAGQLYFDDIVTVRDNHVVRVDLSKVDWMSKFYNSRNYVNLDDILDPERMVVEPEYFSSGDFFMALLSHPMTFFIVLDNVDLTVEVKPIVNYNFPFTYCTEETKQIPLLLTNGMLPKYFIRRLGHKRLLDIDIQPNRRYLYKTAGNYGDNVVHPYTNRFHPADFNGGNLLYIKTLSRGSKNG